MSTFGNAVTDTHVGATSPGWDHHGFAEVRQKLGYNEDVAPRHRSKGKGKSPAPSYANYPVGMRLVCLMRENRTGYTGYLLCRVIDAYACNGRYGPDGVVYLAAEATNAEKYDHLVGHIIPLDFYRMYNWSSDEAQPTEMTVAQFRSLPRDLTRKPR